MGRAMNFLCTILGRAGSKGVKNKNIRTILGKPLISHSIIQAQKTNIFNKIAVSSDSNEILSVAEKYGADFIIERPSALATDTSAKLPAIQHCVLEAEKFFGKQFDIIVDLDPTSPLRKIEDIKSCIDLILNTNAPNVLTAAPSRKSPYFNLVELDETGRVFVSKKLKEKVVRRQDAPKCFDMNASIYVWKREILFSKEPFWNEMTKLYIMPEERSIDIDTELDFEFVSFIAEKRGMIS